MGKGKNRGFLGSQQVSRGTMRWQASRMSPIAKRRGTQNIRKPKQG